MRTRRKNGRTTDVTGPAAVSPRMNPRRSRREGCLGGLESRSGFTLVELLVTMIITAILASALTFAFSFLVSYQIQRQQRLAAENHIQQTEQEITRMLTGAKLVAATTAQTTAATAAGITASQETCTFFQGINDGGSSTLGSDRITFTTTYPGVAMQSVYSQDDYQTQQTATGPVGGLAEVSIGLQPVGQAPPGATGLFERVQQPSDTDPTQGGQEWVLDPTIDSIGFQFWDGQEWEATWDTTQSQPTDSSGQPALPAAVQVSYTIRGETGSPVHMFIVPIPASDLTPNSPATETTSSSTGGTT